MLDGADVPQSPAWWAKILAAQLQDRRNGKQGSKRYSRELAGACRVRPGLDLLDDHFRGDPPLMGVAEGWREHFRAVARIGRLNVAALIVEAKSNRMPLRGFRTAAADDELGDVKARDVMRANNLKVRGREVHDGMLTLADGYAMVTPPQAEGGISVITSEDARECITAHDPATGATLAELKMYRDEWDASDVLHLYVRDEDASVVHRSARRQSRVSSLTTSTFRLGSSWEWDGDPAPMPQNRFPIVRFRNRGGAGEFERHLDTLDRINDQILNKVIIAKIQAFRQMAIKGLPESEKKLVDGKVVEVDIDYSDAFEVAPGSLWQLPADVDLWQSETTDWGPLRQSIKDDLENLAAVTSTPLHIITPDAASGSAEGAGLMREEHVYAVESCRDHAEQGWAEVMATAFAYMGDLERADQTKIEPIWGPVERHSLTERSQAASQAVTTLPIEKVLTDIWGYDPAEVPEIQDMRVRDLLLGVQPTAPAPAPPPAAGATVAGA